MVHALRIATPVNIRKNEINHLPWILGSICTSLSQRSALLSGGEFPLRAAALESSQRRRRRRRSWQRRRHGCRVLSQSQNLTTNESLTEV